MYLKKSSGPRAVKLPDGTVLTQADLPDPKTRRWVASRKAAVVRGILYGLITREDAKATYALSDDELSEWIRAAALHGPEGLKATAIQKLRSKNQL